MSTRRDNVYDTALIVVDWYTKYIRYILICKNWDVELFANIMVKEVFNKFGMPRLITSNWGFFSNQFSGQISAIKSESV